MINFQKLEASRNLAINIEFCVVAANRSLAAQKIFNVACMALCSCFGGDAVESVVECAQLQGVNGTHSIPYKAITSPVIAAPKL